MSGESLNTELRSGILGLLVPFGGLLTGFAFIPQTVSVTDRSFETWRVLLIATSASIAVVVLVNLIRRTVRILDASPQSIDQLLTHLDRSTDPRDGGILKILDRQTAVLLADDTQTLRKLWMRQNSVNAMGIQDFVKTESSLVGIAESAFLQRRLDSVHRSLKLALPVCLAGISATLVLLVSAPSRVKRRWMRRR